VDDKEGRMRRMRVGGGDVMLVMWRTDISEFDFQFGPQIYSINMRRTVDRRHYKVRERS
jgi:hypothetical protein